MIHIGICDDNAAARMQLRSALERNLYARGSEYDIFEFSSGEGMLGWFEKHHTELDLLFLDIEMGSMDGMEAARRIRVRNAAVQLVFVTGYADYVFDGYEVGALDYLMKPAQPDRLNRVLTRAFCSAASGFRRSISLPQYGRHLPHSALRNPVFLFRPPPDHLCYRKPQLSLLWKTG